MDSLTQIVLGAGVGELCMGRKIGNRAQLMGAIAGTIPDLDVLVTSLVKDPVANLKVHRSYSHAFLVHVFLALPFAYLSYRIFGRKYAFKYHYALWFLGFMTHALLDCCTTYGTQFLLPFTDFLVGFNNISVVDPLYTLPFLFLLVLCLFRDRESVVRRRLAIAAVVVSTAYMGLTFVNKSVARSHFEQELKVQNIGYDALSTSPTMLNSVLWAGIAYNDSVIYVGEYSLLQNTDHIDFIAYDRNRDLCKSHPAQRELAVMDWFSKGYNFVQPKRTDTLQYFNIKWGRTDFREREPEEAFIFYYNIVKKEDGTWTLVSVQDSKKKFNIKAALSQLWNRIFCYDK